MSMRTINVSAVALLHRVFRRTRSPIDPEAVCPVREHRRFWRSAIGRHWVCAGCHSPVRPSIVAEWFDVGPRPEPLIVRLSIARARRRMPFTRLNLETDPKAKASEP